MLYILSKQIYYHHIFVIGTKKNKKYIKNAKNIIV